MVGFFQYIHSVHNLSSPGCVPRYLAPESIFLAVNILDRYCSRHIVKIGQYQVVALVAMLIAAKYLKKRNDEPHISGLQRIYAQYVEQRRGRLSIVDQAERRYTTLNLGAANRSIVNRTMTVYLVLQVKEGRSNDSVQWKR